MARRYRWIWFVAIACLYVASVPWYRDRDAEPVLWLGFPDWAAVALLCYVGVAVCNAIAWWTTDIPDEDGSPPDAEVS